MALASSGPRHPKSVTSDLWRQMWPLHRRLFGKPELAAGGNCSGLDKLPLAWPEAACLAMSRHLATAGLFDGTQLHGTPARRDIPEIEKKHISWTTVSTSFLSFFASFRETVCSPYFWATLTPVTSCAKPVSAKIRCLPATEATVGDTRVLTDSALNASSVTSSKPSSSR